MLTHPYFLHAVTPLHAGSGQGMRDIDLPIIREQATRMPFVPGSSVRGVLRATLVEENDRFAVFGPEHTDAHSHAGAISVSDARLLLFPVRSLRTTFAYATSPSLLARYARDLQLTSLQVTLPPLSARDTALVTTDSALLHAETELNLNLDDWQLHADRSGALDAWADHLGTLLFDDAWRPLFKERLVVLPDPLFVNVSELGTEVQARIRIDPEKKTVADHALWYEESLPAESVLVGLIAAEASRRKDVPLTPAEVMARALPKQAALQFGGKASTGHGLCRLVVPR